MSDSNLLRVELQENRTAYEPGETISGAAFWQVDRAKSVEIRLFWYTSGTGTRDAQVIDSTTIVDPQPAGQSAFSFQLPDQPYSFTGNLISLTWAIELVIEPAIGRAEQSARTEFVVTPTGSAIVLSNTST